MKFAMNFSYYIYQVYELMFNNNNNNNNDHVQ